jgi:hypothetical protein
LPPSADSVAVLAEQVGNRQPHRVGAAAWVIGRAEGVADGRMPGAASEDDKRRRRDR